MFYVRKRVILFSLDEYRERVESDGTGLPFEYYLGAYDTIDTTAVGEMANIWRLLDNGFLPPRDREAILLALKDIPLNAAGRKAKERGIQKLRNQLLQ